jgi:hypothetical protein
MSAFTETILDLYRISLCDLSSEITSSVERMTADQAASTDGQICATYTLTDWRKITGKFV